MNLPNCLRHYALALGLAAGLASSANATPLRVGYWTSGISLGFGAVLEAQQFFQKQGLDVQFIHFPDVNGPSRAIAANAIDLAFGASVAGAYSLYAQGVPIKMIAATQVVDGEFVTLAGSPIQSVADFRGKKIGMDSVGSASTGIATAVVQGNYGLTPRDYSLVPANEPELLQFLVQKDVVATLLRPTTAAQMPDAAHKLRVLGTLVDEWRKMTRSSAPPYVGVAVIRQEWLDHNPGGAAKAIVAMRQAVAFGASHQSAVVGILQSAAHLPTDGAQFYARQWSTMNTVSFEPADIDTLKREFTIFKADGILSGDLPSALFYSQPYLDAKASKQAAK